MKYYLGKIEEINGDTEYTDRFLFATRGKPDRYVKKVAREWRGSTNADWDADQAGYWSDHTLVRDDGWREIPQEDFEVLRKYIAVL
jgi:hypothetical protein